MEYENDQRGYDGSFARLRGTPATANVCLDEPRGYERDRSRSPRADRRDNDNARARSASPNGRESRYVLACSCVMHDLC
jgi:transformer-2 protein